MKFVKVMFSQVSACPNGECPCTAWGVCTCLVGRIWAGTPPLGRYTPWAGTHPWAGTPLGRYLPSRYTPQAGTPWAGLPQAGTPQPQCMLGYSQQGGDMYPTGMHSCFKNVQASSAGYLWPSALT